MLIWGGLIAWEHVSNLAIEALLGLFMRGCRLSTPLCSALWNIFIFLQISLMKMEDDRETTKPREGERERERERDQARCRGGETKDMKGWYIDSGVESSSTRSSTTWQGKLEKVVKRSEDRKIVVSGRLVSSETRISTYMNEYGKRHLCARSQWR